MSADNDLRPSSAPDFRNSIYSNSPNLALLSMKSTNTTLQKMNSPIKQPTMSIIRGQHADDVPDNQQLSSFQNLPLDVQGHIWSMCNTLKDGLKGRLICKSSQHINTFTGNHKKCVYIQICYNRYNKLTITIGWFWLNTSNDLRKQLDNKKLNDNTIRVFLF